MKQLLNIYKSTSRLNLQIGIIFLASLGLQLYVKAPDFNAVFGGIIFQFLGSAILGYVISQFIAFYKKNDWRKIWLKIYLLMVALFYLTVILGIYPSVNN
ncbi:hypothetical protein [Carboxylicivirga sp. RSCT41]|uniref:hypothetical protein n=1 Tax=Carboxylicivirga agarovorans TaxID=3417570 RepID=UPI003D324DD1